MAIISFSSSVPVNNTELKTEEREYLETHLMLFYPQKYLPKYVLTTQDIFTHRYTLKKLSPDSYTIKYLTKIIIGDIQNNKRFRKVDCLKVIKTILKNGNNQNSLNSETIENLFYLYQEFIDSESEEILWCISVFLKDRILKNSHIEWLTANYNKSIHIVNRLLRYPRQNKIISEWAKQVYLRDELNDRKAELIATFLEGSIPELVNQESRKIILWSIYYSKVTDSIKQELIKKHYTVGSIDTALEICLRLKYPEVIEFMLTRLEQ